MNIVILNAALLIFGTHLQQQLSLDEAFRVAGAALVAEYGKSPKVYAAVDRTCGEEKGNPRCMPEAIDRSRLDHFLIPFMKGIGVETKAYAENEVRANRAATSRSALRDSGGRITCIDDKPGSHVYALNQARISGDSVFIEVNVTQNGSIAGCAVGGAFVTAIVVRDSSGYHVKKVRTDMTWSGLLELPVKDKRVEY